MTEISFSFHEINITPQPSIKTRILAGFRDRSKSKVRFGRRNLFIRVVILKDENGQLGLVSIDSLYFPKAVARCLEKKLSESLGVSKKNIIFNASHTHSAPSTFSETFGQVDVQYLNYIIKKIRSSSFTSTSFKKGYYSTSETKIEPDLVVGRRKSVRSIRSNFLRKKVELLPNERQKIDKSVRLIRIYDLDKRLAGIVFNMSCHPVFNESTQISSDYPGELIYRLNKKNVFAQFIQGYCGDVRPNLTVSKIKQNLSLRQVIKIILYGKIFRRACEADFEYFVLTILKCILNSHECYEKKDYEIYCNEEEFTFKSINGESRHAKINVAGLGRFLLVSLPAEVTSYYYNLFKNRVPRNRIFFPIGYTDQMIGYLPGKSELKDGGYEVENYKNYGWQGKLDYDNLDCLERTIFEKIEYK